MFKLENDKLTVLGDQRKVISPNTIAIESSEVFHMYSKSKVIEILIKGGNTQTYFENRKNVFSITNGNYTLEYSTPCPPYCN
ncbi:MAG: hypothetical protein IPK06_09775 [Ignavibacteriae bacterium]|nr:hypothetical protein [Ignavibacteriota bacterium]